MGDRPDVLWVWGRVDVKELLEGAVNVPESEVIDDDAEEPRLYSAPDSHVASSVEIAPRKVQS